MFGMSGGEAALLLALVALPLLLFVAVVVWGLRLQARVRRLEAHLSLIHISESTRLRRIS